MSLMDEVYSAQVTSILVGCAIAVIWHWSVLGQRQLAASIYGELIRSRNFAVSTSLFLCLTATAATLWFEDTYVITALLTASAVVVHAALEPSHETFWHHRRVRVIGGGVVVAATTAATFVMTPPFIPLVGSLIIFQAQHRQGRSLMNRLLTEIDQLNRRNVRLSCRVHNERIAQKQSGDDILSKAS